MTDTVATHTQVRSASARALLVVYGLLLLGSGVGAFLLPILATAVASMMFGALLFSAGAIGAITLIGNWRAKGFVCHLLWSAVAVFGGLCIALHLMAGALTLTLVLGAVLIAQGLVGVVHGFHHRSDCEGSWGWMALGGLLTAVLGALLLFALPNAALLVPGLFLALSFFTFGLSVIAAGLAKVPSRDRNDALTLAREEKLV
jgi:uncharacterized membrane protein HdeD (DUF308 family)